MNGHGMGRIGTTGKLKFSQKYERARFLSFGFAALAGICLTGCFTPKGEILVGRPTVYTRERLVNSRLQDVQWLQGQLKIDASSTLQGARSQSQFTGFSAQGQVQFDPLGAANAVGAAQTAQSAQLASQLQNQLVSSALQMKLKALQNGDIRYQDVLGTNTMNATNNGGNATFSPTNGAQNLGSPFVGTNGLPPLPSASNIVIIDNSKIQLTAPEQFRDKLAYRDAVEAEIREKELDDTHDRNGMTLYTLKFDLSILPGKDSEVLGRTDLSFSNPRVPAISVTDEYYNQWLKSFRRIFDTEVASIQRRYLQHFLSDEEKRRLIVFGWKQQADLEKKMNEQLDESVENPLTEDIIQDLRALYKIIRDYDAMLLALSDSSAGAGANEDAVLRTLSRLVQARYEEVLLDCKHTQLVKFGEPIRALNHSGEYKYMIPVKNGGPNEIAALGCVAKQLDADAPTFVYAVEPKEYAQNLSDTSARETVQNFSLALAGAIPQAGVNASAFLNYIKRNQYLLETIKRKPLLVGFIANTNRFGWILGPRFTINENLKLGYEHSVLQESVQATIAVPAWWPTVRVTANNHWLTKSAAISHFHFTDHDAGFAEYDVPLRPNPGALTQAICEQSNDPWFTQPQIHPFWDEDHNKWGYVVQAGSQAQLLIPGRNLWRNPLIFIGSQASSNYQVLPNMEGIVVTFNSVNAVQSLSPDEKDAQRVDLRVVTSDGESVLKNAVTILSGSNPNKQNLFVTMTNFSVVAGTPAITFPLDASLLPQSFNSLVLIGKTPGVLPSVLGTSSDPLIRKNSSVSFTWTAAAAGAPYETKVYVGLKLSPENDPVNVLQGGDQNLVTFANQAQSQLTLDGAANPTINIKKGDKPVVTVLLPAGVDTNLLWHAYPGLAQGPGASPVGLMLTGPNGANPIQFAPGTFVDPATPNKFTFTLDYDKLTKNFSLNKASDNVKCSVTLLSPAENPRWSIPVFSGGAAGTITFNRTD